MSYQPMVVGTGFGAWAMLTSTMARQKAAFSQSPEIVRRVDQFQDRMPNITNATELVSDRTTLQVALGAFDLSDDLNNRFFVEKLLLEGTSDTRALANRLQDQRYKSLADDFGPEKFALNLTSTDDFVSDISQKYRDVSFELAVGETDENLRLGLAFHRLLPEIAANTASNEAAWYKVIGLAPVRQVFETAFGLPPSTAQLDVDRQVRMFKDKATGLFGVDALDQIATSENMESLVQRFLLRQQVSAANTASSSQTALTLISQTAGMMRDFGMVRH